MEKIFPKEETIRGIRAIDGEIIGDITITQNTVTVTNPLRIIIGRDPKGGIVMDMVPYTLLTQKLVFTRENLICEPFALDKEMVDQYLKMTTGIALS